MTIVSRTLAAFIVLGGTSLSISTASGQDAEARARAFVARHEKEVKPLEITSALAWWVANTTGKDADFAAKEEAQNKLDAALTDAAKFAELKALREAKIADKVLAREVELLYLMYQEKQVDPALLKAITAKANAIEKAFNVFRARVGDQELADGEVRKRLKASRDSNELKGVWEASKKVGVAVEADLKELVKLRNQAAQALGFRDFHHQQLALNEQDQNQVVALFDDLDKLTRGPFLAAKAEIDGRIANNLGLGVADLRPWHYQDPFFQESPAVFEADLDAVYSGVDILKLCRDFYQGIGLPIHDVIAKSDLYEKPGKSPHAFCTDIDREGDVRVLANIVPTEYWMGTMLHELGHSVYSSKNIPATLPYILRGEAHILTTEGIAMMFEKFSKDADWLTAMGVAVPNPKAFDEVGAKLHRNKLLIFSRWCQVMLRFEKSMYANPDQDLNKLWWDLVEQYQGLKRPEGRNAPDFAAKVHIVSAPAYYHNYMMGELFAAQVHHAICREALGGIEPGKATYVGQPAVGRFLKEKVFGPGRMLRWDDLTRFATGAELNPRAFASDFGGR